MNVLFIAFDDLRPQLNCYGQSQMKTPNIDRLADEGLTFRRAYTQQAICMASRSSILSGIRPEHAQLYSCGSLQDLAPDITTMNEHFANNGYTTEAIGKIYHHASDHRAQFGDRWYDPTGDWVDRGYVTKEAIAEQAANARFNKGKKGRGPAYEMAEVPDNRYIDGANTDYALSRLEQLQKQSAPFFLAMGFHKPHLPWCAPKKYWDMYPPEELVLSPAPEYPSHLTPYSLTNWGELRNYFGIPQGKDQISEELALQLRRAYYASVSYVDAQLGRIMDALEENGLKENTIIVLWGDHGFKLGDHQAWSKHTTFEIDTQVPLIISVPGMENAGRSSSSFAGLIDLYPTLCELADLEQPDHLEGKSLVPILKDPGAQVQEAAFSIFPRNRTNEKKTITGFSMRTPSFRYTEWIHIASGRLLAAELYNHQTDSLENFNVARDKAYASAVKTLSKQLHRHFDDAIPGLDQQPVTLLYPPADLLFARQRYQQNDEAFVQLVNEIKVKADHLMDIEPYSVMQKKKVPPSKNKHDYYSLGIYWWPNPDTKDGLPYVRHDGKRNPEYDDFDGPAIREMSNGVFILSLAYFYTGHEPYAQKANELIHTWFIDPSTKMNPHLEYGQAIPGITEGRGIGIIETGRLLKVVDAAGLLKGAPSYSAANHEELMEWFKQYNHWLTNSQKGWDERMWHNNHGSSYDSQVAGFSEFTGQDAIAKIILDSVIIKRINRQIQPDGSQPWELERTKSMSYSIKNLLHLMENAIIAQHYGIDLWHYESEDGRSITKAIRFLIPYMLGKKDWPYEQYGGLESQINNFQELIWVAHKFLDDQEIDEAFDILFAEGIRLPETSLLYPVFGSKMEMDAR